MFPAALQRLVSIFRMNSTSLFSIFFCLIFTVISSQLDFAYAKDEAPPAAASAGKTTKAPPSTSANTTTKQGPAGNHTGDGSDTNGYGISDAIYDTGMLRRSFYVLIGCTVIAILFFTFKWVR